MVNKFSFHHKWNEARLLVENWYIPLECLVKIFHLIF